MRDEMLNSVEQHLPEGEVLGRIVVVSDYRLLNFGHASALRRAGYAVYTAVTCTDVPRIFDSFSVDHIDLIAFASLVHGWHHQEAEDRPESIPPKTDIQWHTRNFLHVVEAINARQQSPPKVIIAKDLIAHDRYDISEDALMKAGICYETYAANNPPSIVGFLTDRGSQALATAND